MASTRRCGLPRTRPCTEAASSPRVKPEATTLPRLAENPLAGGPRRVEALNDDRRDVHGVLGVDEPAAELVEDERVALLLADLVDDPEDVALDAGQGALALLLELALRVGLEALEGDALVLDLLAQLLELVGGEREAPVLHPLAQVGELLRQAAALGHLGLLQGLELLQRGLAARRFGDHAVGVDDGDLERPRGRRLRLGGGGEQRGRCDEGERGEESAAAGGVHGHHEAPWWWLQVQTEQSFLGEGALELLVKNSARRRTGSSRSGRPAAASGSR